MAFKDFEFDPTFDKNNLNDNFYRWFGKSKVTIKGKPRRVYHGSTFSFDSFSTKFGNPENAFGKGFYFSSTYHDINVNYSHMKGPDLIHKIERGIEELEDELTSEEIDDLIDAYISTNNIDLEKYNKDWKLRSDVKYNALKPLLQGKIYGDTEGSIMPCYLRMEKPVYIGFGDRDTKFEYNLPYDEETDDYGEPTGEGVEIFAHFEDNYSIDLSSLQSNAMDYGFFTSKELYDAVHENWTYDDDDTPPGEALSDLWCGVLSYDGIIQNASAFFGKKSGRKMQNVERAIHYIVFTPNQVKSVNNKGTWSRSSNKLIEEIK